MSDQCNCNCCRIWFKENAKLRSELNTAMNKVNELGDKLATSAEGISTLRARVIELEEHRDVLISVGIRDQKFLYEDQQENTKLRARVEKLEKVVKLIELLDVSCQHLHHNKADYHIQYPCPVETRFGQALKDCEETDE